MFMRVMFYCLQVMRNMNRTGHYQTRDDNILVQIAHVLHMAELWEKVAESYKNIARLLDPESDICACVTDIENNDILNYLNLIAFKLRYPGITSGNHTLTDRCKYTLTDRCKYPLTDRCKYTFWPKALKHQFRD